MDFKLLGCTSNEETIAVGNAIRELKRLVRKYGKGAGVNGRESAGYSCRMEPRGWLSYIGMRLMEWDEGITRSNATLPRRYEDSEEDATRCLH
jgi:hypothetical protein